MQADGDDGYDDDYYKHMDYILDYDQELDYSFDQDKVCL